LYQRIKHRVHDQYKAPPRTGQINSELAFGCCRCSCCRRALLLPPLLHVAAALLSLLMCALPPPSLGRFCSKCGEASAADGAITGKATPTADHFKEPNTMFIAGCLQHIGLADVLNTRLSCKRVHSIELRLFLPSVFHRSLSRNELHALVVKKFCEEELWPMEVLLMLLQSGVPIDHPEASHRSALLQRTAGPR